MRQLLIAVDGLLRGSRTSEVALRQSEVHLPVRMFGPAAIVLGAIFGLCMASYAIANRPASEASQQALAAMVKLPALFLVTLVISFPSLYVFNVLVGCRLDLRASLRLLVSAIVVNLAVTASLGPIVAFFAVSTKSYPFMVLLNVVMLALGGGIGLAFLARSLRTLAAHAAEREYADMLAHAASAQRESAARAQGEGDGNGPVATAAPSASDVPSDGSGARAVSGGAYQFRGNLPSVSFVQRESFVRNRTSNASLILAIWVLLYGSVGAQTGWLLRPFIGHPEKPFTFFRERSGNFFLGVVQSLERLFQ
jgi:hypothetical protein